MSLFKKLFTRKTACSDGGRILFIHISKTAGTSFRRVLEKEYGRRQVFPGKRYLKYLPNRDYMQGGEIVRNYDGIPSHKVLAGHFTANISQMLPPVYRQAVFLRDPVQRSLSALAHFSRSRDVPVSRLLDSTEFMVENICDYQTRILGAVAGCDPSEAGAASDSMLAMAIQRLEAMDFVGLTEHFAESCRIFDQKFHTRVSRYVCKTNVLRPTGGELSEYASAILPLVKLDTLLYEKAVSRFADESQGLRRD